MSASGGSLRSSQKNSSRARRSRMRPSSSSVSTFILASVVPPTGGNGEHFADLFHPTSRPQFRKGRNRIWAVPRYYKTEAIVLRSIRLREADRVLHLYTSSRGRVGAV